MLVQKLLTPKKLGSIVLPKLAQLSYCWYGQMDKCCLDKCHHDSWRMLSLLWSLVQIGSVTAEIMQTLSLHSSVGWWWCAESSSCQTQLGLSWSFDNQVKYPKQQNCFFLWELPTEDLRMSSCFCLPLPILTLQYPLHEPLPGECTYLDLPTYTKMRRRKKRRIARDKENC